MSPASGDGSNPLPVVPATKKIVSIQLMSPASGDNTKYNSWNKKGNVSIQLMSPASGDLNEVQVRLMEIREIMFPFN